MSSDVGAGLGSQEIHAWHGKAVASVLQRVRGGRLAHALLISGADGVGKLDFAHWLAGLILCGASGQQRDGACGSCKPCRLLGAGNHPDLLRIAPPGADKPIRVDTVREFCAALALTPQFAGYRVGIIETAEAMNVNAANSLLKSLEEPPPATLLLLVTTRPGGLLATVRSRCQQLTLGPPPRAAALAWLEPRLGAEASAWLRLARGAPLRALALAEEEVQGFRRTLFGHFAGALAGSENPVRAASKYARTNLADVLRWLESYTSDLIRLRAVGAGVKLVNADLQDEMQRLAPSLDLPALFRYLDRVRETAPGAASLNTQLAVEDFLVRAARLTGPGPVVSRGS